MPQGLRFLRTALLEILAKRRMVLSPRMMHIIEDPAEDWRRLDERIEGLSTDITSLVARGPACGRLVTVPGVQSSRAPAAAGPPGMAAAAMGHGRIG